MSKKSIIQFVVSIVFFSIAAYMIYGVLNPEEVTKETSVKSSGSTLNVDSLLNRKFKTEEIDVLTSQDFKKLQDHSVKMPETKKSDIGRENPFEPI